MVNSVVRICNEVFKCISRNLLLQCSVDGDNVDYDYDTAAAADDDKS